MRKAVLEATADLLIESGLESVELSTVANLAGVGKSTVYRRWGTVTALVADLLVDMAVTSAKRPSTGNLHRDLLAISRLIQRTLADPRQGRLFAAIIAAATCNRQTSAALAGFYNARITEFCGTVHDGIIRGEAPPGTDPAEVIRYLSAPLYYRMLTGNGVPDSKDATRATNAAMAAIAAGVFIR